MNQVNDSALGAGFIVLIALSYGANAEAFFDNFQFNARAAVAVAGTGDDPGQSPGERVRQLAPPGPISTL